MFEYGKTYDCETSDGMPVKFVFKKRFGVREDLRNIYYQLQDICEAESEKLYRLARKMVAHGCDPENVQKCRNEALLLMSTGYPERILDETIRWDYAFKF